MSMWTYSHATRDQSGASMFWFTDCMEDWGDGLPFPFCWVDVSRLRLVQRES